MSLAKTVAHFDQGLLCCHEQKHKSWEKSKFLTYKANLLGFVTHWINLDSHSLTAYQSINPHTDFINKRGNTIPYPNDIKLKKLKS